MNVLVTGGRDYKDEKTVFEVLDKVYLRFNFDCLGEGGATGADRLAAKWAAARGVKSKRYAADWSKHGVSAGRKRNQKMLIDFKPNILVAFPGSAGTKHMTIISKIAGVRIITVNKDGTHDRI